MRLEVLSTGSKANCYALMAGEEILLLDAGLRASEIMRGIEFQNVCGALVTHEHQDHIRGAAELMRYGVTAFMSEGTAGRAGLMEAAPPGRLHLVSARQPFDVGGFQVMPFQTEHDAAQPLGFLIRCRFTGETLLYATDTYYLRNTFPGVHYWIVECNHCRAIMDAQYEKGLMDSAMRRRLITAHMSLERLLEALKANDLSKTRKIVLIHLSDERADEAEMVERVGAFTGIPAVAARDGMEIDLELTPF